MLTTRIVDDISREDTVAARRARTYLLMFGAQASPFQVVFRRIRGSRRVSLCCHVLKYSADGDQTTRPEMASGLIEASALLSLSELLSPKLQFPFGSTVG